MLVFPSFLKRDVLAASVLALAVLPCVACGGSDDQSQTDSGVGATNGGTGSTTTGGANAGSTGNGGGTNANGDANGSANTNGGSGSENTGSDGNGSTTNGGDPDGGTTDPGTTGGGPVFSPTDKMFRATSLKMVAPDLITKPLGIEGPSIRGSIQTAIDDSLVKDVEPEGGDMFVDLSVIVRFLGKFDPAAAGHVSMGGALCPFPYDATKVCGPLKANPFDTPLSFQPGMNCTLDDTTRLVMGPCFKSNKGTVSVNVQLIGKVPLQDAQVIGSWANGGADGIAAGWVRGFMPEETAKNTKLPEKLPAAAVLIGIKPGTPMIDFLSNREKVDNKGVKGWWFMMSFAASPVIFDQTVGPDA